MYRRRRFSSRRYSYRRRRSNSLSARGVRLRRPATGRVQPLISRARTTTLTKFWEGAVILSCHKDFSWQSPDAERRNVRIFNLLTLGTGVYNRLANRVRVHSMVIHLRFIWNPFVRTGDLYNDISGVMANDAAFPGMPHMPTCRITMLLVFVRHPRVQPPLPSSLILPVSSEGFERIDLDEGTRILLRKEFVLSVDPCHAFTPSGGQPAKVLYSKGKGSDFEYDFKVPLGFVMAFDAMVPTPTYGNITQGAVLAYFLSDYSQPAAGGTFLDYVCPTVDMRTRTAFTDV